MVFFEDDLKCKISHMKRINCLSSHSVPSAIVCFLSDFTKQIHQAIISITHTEPVSLALKGNINDERRDKTGRK